MGSSMYVFKLIKAAEHTTKFVNPASSFFNAFSVVWNHGMKLCHCCFTLILQFVHSLSEAINA